MGRSLTSRGVPAKDIPRAKFFDYHQRHDDSRPKRNYVDAIMMSEHSGLVRVDWIEGTYLGLTSSSRRVEP